MELACDAKMQNRHYDNDGMLRIERTPISKATVNPYYGREIPGSEKLGLSPDRVYQLLRDPGELAKAAPTFRTKPLMFEHIAVSSEDPKQDSIAGTVGSDVIYEHPYLMADLCVWDKEAIAGIETDTVRELSSSYRYRPDMTPGVYEGKHYDGVMRDIEANHVALVKQGRAGPDVMAADSGLETKMETKFNKQEAVAAANKVAGDEDDNAAKYANIAAKGGDKKARDKKKAKDWEPDYWENDPKEQEEEKDNPQGQDRKAKDKKKAKDAEGDDPEDSDEEEREDEDASRVEDCDAKDKKKAKDAEGDDPEDSDEEEREDEDASRVEDCDAKDKRKAKDSRKANDEAIRLAMDAFKAELRQAEDARREVRSVVGEVLAMDSAEDIYSFALDEMRVDHSGVKGINALRAIFRAANGSRKSHAEQFAFDSAQQSQKIPGASRYIKVM